MKNEKYDIDCLLKKALDTGTETPDTELVQKIKNKLIKGDYNLKTNNRIKYSFRKTIIIIAALCILTTTTVFAAWNLNLLKPSEVAEILGDNALSAAFDSEDAININQAITSGNYKFTLLSIVSGSNLRDKPYYSSEIEDDCTYSVIAIQNADGSPFADDYFMSDSYKSFYAVPFVKGFKPWQVNFWGGGASMDVVDGVLYYLRECDNIKMFADRGLYLVVTRDDMPISSSVLSYDEMTQETTVNPNYNGAIAIFDLPIDKSFADPEKAEEYLRSIGYYDDTSTVDIAIAARPENDSTHEDAKYFNAPVLISKDENGNSASIDIDLFEDDIAYEENTLTETANKDVYSFTIVSEN